MLNERLNAKRVCQQMIFCKTTQMCSTDEMCAAFNELMGKFLMNSFMRLILLAVQTTI